MNARGLGLRVVGKGVESEVPLRRPSEHG